MRSLPGQRRCAIAPKYLAVLAAVLFISAGIAGFYSVQLHPTGGSSSSSTSSTASSTSSTCESAPPVTDGTLKATTFGAVTEYDLSANRTPAGFAVAPDGSVWVGEWGLPGVAHIYPNGTLTEYKWPYPDNSPISICGQLTEIWGVALWNGTVWGADNSYSRLISVDPATGRTEEINLTSGVFPYTLAVGDGDLWFTDNLAPGMIGKITPNSTSVQYYSLPDSENILSQYIVFRNATLAYLLTADLSDLQAGFYSFDPMSANITFTSIPGAGSLYEPTSLALMDGGIWATEHSASAMAFFNYTTSEWTVYPTSTVPYVPNVLTYFDGSNGTAVWFNEHYSNRMGEITGDGRYLTEYSITNPPIFNITTILENYNMVTMGLTTNYAWFAAATAGIVGFVSTAYTPSFSVTANATSVQLPPGGSAQVSVEETGNVTGSNLALQFEDSEFYNGTAVQLHFTPGTITTTESGVSTFTLTLTASSAIKPGDYVAAVTIDNRSIYRTVYFSVVVA